MSSTKEQDAVPYQNEPLTSSNAGVAGERRMAGDARRSQVSHAGLMGYLGPDGNPLALTGDEEAPFIKVIYDSPALAPVSSIPQFADSGVLIASQVAAELHEAWITDSRDPLTLPAPRWILLFDRFDAPTNGDVPTYAPIGMCTGGTTAVDFIEAPMFFAAGIVIAISTTPNAYTPIVAAADYAITARVLRA